MPFFEHYGDELLIDNIDTFTSIFNELSGPVEKRTHDSSKEEKWVLFKFLEYRVLNGSLDLPIQIRKSEQPDLIIVSKDNSIYGLELTESTDPLYLAARTLAEKRGKGEWPINSCFKHGHNLTHKDLESTLQSPDKPLRGMGWCCPEGLVKTAFDLKQTISKKLKHYNEQKYQNLECVDLLIYYTGPSGHPTSDEQILDSYPTIVPVCIEESRPKKVFNNIHLLWSRTMHLDDAGHPYMVLTWKNEQIDEISNCRYLHRKSC